MKKEYITIIPTDTYWTELQDWVGETHYIPFYFCGGMTQDRWDWCVSKGWAGKKVYVKKQRISARKLYPELYKKKE